MSPKTPALSLELLGPPRLKLNGRRVQLPYLKAEALLYYLAATGRPHSRAALAALLWSQSAEKQARNSLRSALYTVRRALKPVAPLLTSRDRIGLSLADIDLDLTAFQTGVTNPASSAQLAQTLALWRGPFLEGLHLPQAPTFAEWLAERRHHYENLYRAGLLDLSRRYLAQQQFEPARQTLETLLALDPLHEPAHQQLMRLYRRDGNRVAALRQYETIRTRLRRELGVDPAPATQALHLKILQEDDRPSPLAFPPPARKTASLVQFVGRRQELARLNQLYQTVLPHGPARVAMLSGEPGIGKTRLAHEWLAALPQTRTLSTRCFETEQTLPFQPWIDLIRTTFKQTPLEQLELADVWLAELAQLVPEIRSQRPDLETASPPDPDLARGRIIQAVYHWLETLGRRQPLCIFIDDWQWLDQASLTLLRYLLRPQPDSRLPLLILGAQRRAETVSGWAQLKTDLTRQKLLDYLIVERLSLPEVTLLVRSMGLASQFTAPQFLRRLRQETAGNPLFIIETMQSLEPDQLRAEQWPMPPTIQGVIQSRLARLSPETHQILSGAAVVGQIFDDNVLGRACDYPLETVLQALDEALMARLIEEHRPAQSAGTGPLPLTSRYDFAHDKIRMVLLAGLTSPRRRYWHLRIAAALETITPTDFGRLGYHFELAGDLLQARRYGLRAARQAVELYADQDALNWYDKVESWGEVDPPALSPADIEAVSPFQQSHVSRRRPLDVLGLVYRQRGLIQQRVGRYDEAAASFRAALLRGEQRRRPDEQAAAHNLLSFLAYLRSDYDSVDQHARQALELASQADEPALRAPGLRHLGIAIYRTADYDQARQLYDEALAAYRQAGDRLGMAGVYNNIGFVLRTQARYPEAIEAFEQAIAIYEETGQTEGVALICSNIGRTYAFSGQLKAAQQYLERGLALSEEVHTDWITAKICRTLGSVSAQAEQWPRAKSYAQRAYRLAGSLGSDEDLGAALRLLAEIAQTWPESGLDSPARYFEQSIALLQKVGAQDELERAQNAFAAYRAREA